MEIFEGDLYGIPTWNGWQSPALTELLSTAATGVLSNTWILLVSCEVRLRCVNGIASHLAAVDAVWVSLLFHPVENFRIRKQNQLPTKTTKIYLLVVFDHGGRTALVVIEKKKTNQKSSSCCISLKSLKTVRLDYCWMSIAVIRQRLTYTRLFF